MRRTRARSGGGLVLAVLLLVTAGCGDPSPDEARKTYCAQVKKDADEITRIVDEGGAGAALQVLPKLEELADLAPRDLTDEWQTYLNALHGWRDALDDTGLEPSDVDEGLPRDLSREDRRRLLGAISEVQGPEVKQAAEGIEQQALDVCGTPLL
ncbi:hypothetical protein [Nocardioides jensenii]|uniref:hypothetical protein n=1 Tax=Nocardioides jensenii TaxID=1843 RepID=UPI000833F4E1|nr:hypothetical protein [Nocardioides jensenii]